MRQLFRLLKVTMSRLLLAALASVILVSSPTLADSLEQIAAREWQNHVYTLRAWVGGDNIETDEQGRVLQSDGPVSWTQSRFEVRRVSVHPDKIEFQGNRVGVVYNKHKHHLVDRRLLPLRVVMRIDTSKLQPSDLAQITNSLFITDMSQLCAALPEFWKLAMRQLDKNGQFYCLSDKPSATLTAPATGEFYPISSVPGTTPPAVLNAPDPDYDEVAKTMHVMGVSLLSAVVGTDGTVHDVQIKRPVGMGLDERAVETIRGWLFRPATRDGKPVAAQVLIEVNFQLVR